MDIPYILADKTQKFINDHYKDDTSDLTLKYASHFNNWNHISYQLSGKQKSESKLPTWFKTRDIIFPKSISIEQTSSEITARYKSKIVSGDSLIDLTGGFGVDAYYFSKKINSVTHCEIAPELTEIVSHNINALSVTNINCINQDSLDFLKNTNEIFDWIYIDPARRTKIKRKVFFLEDCAPNVLENLDFYISKCRQILIKTSPLLDLTKGIQQLKYVKEIHIVAVKNEVKELLWVLNTESKMPIQIHTVNLIGNHESKLTFDWESNLSKSIAYGLPQNYVYEPNGAIMKSGNFGCISTLFPVEKLHANSHLFTSESLLDFPGRKFKITQVLPYRKKEIKDLLFKKKLNISTRNFPESTNFIQAKWQIKDGGENYCFFTTNMDNEKIVIFCTKV